MKIVKSLFLAICVAVSANSFAVDPVQTSFLTNTAASGYDTVAYFKESAAIKGSKDFSYEWNGAVWRFASEENMKLFAEDPEAYAPQFGGYCSYAVGLGKTAPGDPQQFSIVDDKLYLNYSSKTRVLWEDDKENLITSGNENWQRLLEE